MGNVPKFFEYVAYGIIFLLGISSSMILIRDYNSLYDQQKKTSIQNVIYESVYDTEDDIITSDELLATLFYELEYDIQIDDVLISKSENLTPYILAYESYSTLYKRSYQYNDYGVITRVIYKRMQQL